MPVTSIIFRIVLAAVLGGIVGVERERQGRDAGLRTHMLVCVGSALFMVVSALMALEYKDLGVVDPSRIAAGVVTGIGFLGAGTLLRYDSYIKGLTTAASIWVVSAIGLAVGAGFYMPGLITALVVIGVLMLSPIADKLHIHINLSNKKKKKMNIDDSDKDNEGGNK